MKHLYLYALLITTVHLHAADLRNAIKSGNFEETMQLMNQDNINTPLECYDHETPLHRASRYGHTTMVRELISRGANVDAKDICERTPLHMTSLNGHINIVRELVGHGADVNAGSCTDTTPLHRAAEGGHLETVKFLLECGANPEKKNDTNATALDIAEINGFVDLANYIRNWIDIPVTKGVIMEELETDTKNS